MNDEKILEVVDGISIKMLLERANILKNSEIISLAFLLNAGDISDLENNKRYVCDYDIDMKKEINDFITKLKNIKHIRIWYSSLDSEDLCFYLFVLYLVKKYGNSNNVSHIDVKKINKWSIANLGEKEIKNLFKIEEKLDDKIMKENYLYWKKLVNENGDLRLIIDQKLISKSYDYLDNIILEKIKHNGETSKWELECSIISNNKCGIYSSLIINYRINQLIKDKKIIVTKTQNKTLESGYKIRDEFLKINTFLNAKKSR